MKWTPTQSLDFPRADTWQVFDQDSDGDLAIPQPVKDATCEVILWLIKTDGDEALADDMARGINNQAIGKTSFSGMSANGSAVMGPRAHMMMRKYYRRVH